MPSEAYEHACDGGDDKVDEKQRGQPLHIPDGSNLYTHAAHGHTHPFKILRTPPYCRCLDGQLLVEIQDCLGNYVDVAPHDGVECGAVERVDNEH